MTLDEELRTEAKRILGIMQRLVQAYINALQRSETESFAIISNDLTGFITTNGNSIIKGDFTTSKGTKVQIHNYKFEQIELVLVQLKKVLNIIQDQAILTVKFDKLRLAMRGIAKLFQPQGVAPFKTSKYIENYQEAVACPKEFVVEFYLKQGQVWLQLSLLQFIHRNHRQSVRSSKFTPEPYTKVQHQERSRSALDKIAAIMHRTSSQSLTEEFPCRGGIATVVELFDLQCGHGQQSCLFEDIYQDVVQMEQCCVDWCAPHRGILSCLSSLDNGV